MSHRSPQVIDLDRLAESGGHQLIDWRGHRFEIVEVADLAPGYRQCLLRFVDAPDRLPLSVPASDLTDARPVTD